MAGRELEAAVAAWAEALSCDLPLLGELAGPREACGGSQ